MRKPNPVLPKAWRTVALAILTPIHLIINDHLLTLNNLNPVILRRTLRNRPSLLGRCLNNRVDMVVIHRLLNNNMALHKCNHRLTDRPIRNRRTHNLLYNMANDNNRTLHHHTNPYIQLLLKPHRLVLEVLLVAPPLVLLPVELLAGESMI